MYWYRLRRAIAWFAFASAGVAAPTAYVPNEGSGDVSLIDTATDKVTGHAQARARRPAGIAVSADGSRLYLSDQAANALVVVDPAKRDGDRDTFRSGDSPEAIYLSPGRQMRSPRPSRRTTRCC